MSWIQRRSERRGSPRFEVVGTLRGTAAADQYVQIRNIGPGGALVESFGPLPVDVPVSLKLRFGLLETLVEARVRYVTSLIPAGYLIRLEFVDCDATLLDRLDQLLDTT